MEKWQENNSLYNGVDPNTLKRAVVLNANDGTMRAATDAEQAQYDADRKNVRVFTTKDFDEQ